VTASSVRILRALFWVYVVATCLHLAWVVACEPFAFDAWNVTVDTGAEPASISRFFSFWHQQYTSSNPRLGQPLAYLAYKTVGFAEVGTPLAYLAIVLAGFVLGVGRWPARESGRDLATLAIGIGFLWFAAPSFAAYMFCRAYATNYVWAAAIQLWLLAAIRLHDVRRPVGPLKLAGIALLGVAAGMCNEHTGPTLLVMVVVYLAWSWRSRRVHTLLGYAAAAGVLTGYALIFFAPGQSQRYDGIGERYTLVQQVIVRGLTGNLDIMQGFLYAAAPLLTVVVFVVAIGILAEGRDERDLSEVRRRQRQALATVGIALAAGALITMTVFASPKLGPRFYMHAMLGLLAGVMATTRTFLHSPRSFAPFVVIAVVASGYAAARTIPSYTGYKADSDSRLAYLAATPRGGVYTAEAWDQVAETWWFLGDDFRDQKKRELVARYFQLDRVLFRGSDVWSTLGVSDVKLTMLSDFEPGLCIDELEQLDLPPYIGRDVAALHHAFQDAIAEIQRTAPARLRSIDLTATFLGSRPPLPRDRTYVARWRDGDLEAYTARLGRAGRSTRRTITIDDALVAGDWEIYLVAIGDPPKLLGKSSERQFHYRPWRTAQYWTMACKPEACFVMMSVHHSI
jgi:Family of unknown function (DUF6056)